MSTHDVNIQRGNTIKQQELTAVTTRIPILRLDTNIPIKSNIDTALPIAGAMSLGFGAHVEMVAVFGAGGAFGDG